tara:strand:+ start:3538 stop:5145 length:1608 start_codon:yes stop_codon:yes gene_type:complete
MAQDIYGLTGTGFTDASGKSIGLPVHQDYNTYVEHWKFLKRSYLGGAEYKRGQYLKRYQYEDEGEYLTRLSHAAEDNHCRSIIHTYNAFLYRQQPKRDFGWLEGSPEIEQFLKDADLEGQSWEAFMRDVNIQSSIYGHCVVLVDRPETVVGTRAEELAQGIRPFCQIYTPENILNWRFVRQPNGHYEIAELLLLEQDERPYQRPGEFYVRKWTPDTIELFAYTGDDPKTPMKQVDSRPNNIGKVPAVWVYAQKGPIRGIGVSDISGVAQSQRFLANLYSEAEQLVSLTNHPSLVKTRSVSAQAGAGAIIDMPEELDPNLKPYLLQPNGGNLEAILKTMDETVKSIDRMAHMGSIRAIETRQMSGIAMQSEFLMLDAKLCEKAKNLELSEEQIFRLFSLWQGQAWDGEIKYPMAFHIRDKNLDMDIINKAASAQRDSATATPNVKSIIDQKTIELLARDEDEMEEMQNQMADDGAHPPMESPQAMIQHMRDMIEKDGLTNEEIMELHPEISNFFTNTGAANGQTETSPQGQENGTT